jgi:hypothetical protein
MFDLLISLRVLLLLCGMNWRWFRGCLVMLLSHRIVTVGFILSD